MRIVIDTNVLLSALIKDSTTREIIVKSSFSFFYPETSFHEVRKYKELVKQKAKLSGQEYNTLLGRILEHILLIPDETIRPYITEADELLGEIDKDDVIFLATALSMDDAIIWSDDAHFDHQKKIKVVKTKEMV